MCESVKNNQKKSRKNSLDAAEQGPELGGVHTAGAGADKIFCLGWKNMFLSFVVNRFL